MSTKTTNNWGGQSWYPWISIFPTSRLPPRWGILRWGILRVFDYQDGDDHFLWTGPSILLPELWIEIFTRLSQVQDCYLLDLSCDLCFPKCICSLSEFSIYQDDLCSLCLTCKYFYNLASQPSLWYSIITIIMAGSHHQCCLKLQLCSAQYQHHHPMLLPHR